MNTLAENGTAIGLENLSLRFAEHHALRDISMTLAPGRVLALLGPSGCGKTTLLKLLAGLSRPSSGRVLFDNQLVASRDFALAPQKRRLGMVFQDYALWPHLSVQANVAFPLEMQKLEPTEVRRRVQDALERVGLGALGQRAPAQLSGGQQQRVALARAIVARPRLLLFDEPLSNLDRDLRESLCDDMAQLLRQIGTTAVYVTHDHEEACTIADEVAIMAHGQLLQQAPAPQLWSAPANAEVARFLKLGALVPARRSGTDIRLSDSNAVLPDGLLHPQASGPACGDGELLIPAHAVTPGPLDGAALRAQVATQSYRSGAFTTRLDLPGGTPLMTVVRERLHVGDTVGLHIAPRQLHWFQRASVPV